MTGEENKKNPFRVPDNYFDEVSRKILAETSGRKTTPKKSLVLSLRPILAVAAGIVILLTIGYFSTRFSGKTEPAQELMVVLDSDPGILLEELDLLTLENSNLFNGAYVPELSDDEIIDYLAAEDIDISLLLEKL